MGGGMSPLLMSILAFRALTNFSGEDIDWENFSRDWQVYEAMLEQSWGGKVPDLFMFEILYHSLDRSMQDKLRSSRIQNPTLTYHDFWESMEKIFVKDQSQIRRNDWRRVSLPRGNELSSQIWRAYQNAFELAVSRIEDITEQEIEAKIIQDLPSIWRDPLVKAIVSRAQNEFWVRVAKPSPLTKQELEPILSEMLGTPGVKVEEHKLAFLVDCQSQVGQDLFRSIDSWMTPRGS